MADKIISLACSHCGEVFLGTQKQQRQLLCGQKAFCSLKCYRLSKPTALERFLTHTRRLPNGCLDCDLATNPDGYPMMRVDGRLYKASHVAYWLHHGRWPPKDIPLDHTCHVPGICIGGKGDPHRRCVEWSHLKPNARNNSSERSNGGRAAAARALAQAFCIHGHKRTPDNIYTSPSTGAKSCRACKRIESRERKSKKRH